MPDLVFRLTLVGIAACNCLISLFIEVSRSLRCIYSNYIWLCKQVIYFYHGLVVKMSYNLP